MTLPTRARAVLWAVLAVGAAAGAPLLGRSNEAGTSALVFTPWTYDFGTVPAGGVVRAQFPFVNESEAPVRILSVYGTCGCVTAKTTSSYVEPRGTGTVEATLVTDGRSGPQRLRIRVRTDEGKDGGTRLTLKGEIHVPLRPRPPRIYLGPVVPGSEHTKEIEVEKLEPVSDMMISCAGEGLSATKLDESERGFTLRVDVKVPWLRGRHGNGIRLTSREGSTWIPVVWIVRSPFELSRKDIEIKNGKGGLRAKPRWPGVKLARVETHGLPLKVTVNGEQVLVTFEGSQFDIPSGATIDLVPDPATLGNVIIPVYVRPD